MNSHLTVSREVEQVVQGRPTSDGDGVKLTRVLTQDLQQRLDPFLMMDVFYTDQAADYVGGFPDHPHRGFETITYMLDGRMRHRDSGGGHGLLQPGGVQWMNAGRGVIHSEMPEQAEGLMRGFQLWLNLPAKHKMSPPWYRDLSPTELCPLALADGVTGKLIAGSIGAVNGPISRPITEPILADLRFSQAADLSLPVPPGHHAFMYVYEGQLSVGEQSSVVDAWNMAILNDDHQAPGLRLRSPGPAAALLVAGRPLNEPIVQHGPFVMNSLDQIRRALSDYQRGTLVQ